MNDDLLFFDCESTGTDPIADRLTEVSVVRADGTVVFSSLVHPGRPIPAQVQRLTGITDDMVTADGVPFFHEIAYQLADVLRDKPLAGFGCAEFDVPLLAEEFERAGVAYSFGPVLDVGHLYKAIKPRSLTAAVAEYVRRNHSAAHRAEADAQAVREVLAAMPFWEPAVYDKSADQLRALARGDRPERADPAGRLLLIDGVVCFGDRKHRGVPVAHDLGYALWMLARDFPLSTKRVLAAEVERIERERAAEAEARLEAAITAEANDAGGMVDLAGDTDRIPF